MKKLLLLSCLILATLSIVVAQDVKDNATYYYNSFDNGTTGSLSTSSSFSITPTSAVSNNLNVSGAGRSIRSVGNSTAGSTSAAFIPTGSSITADDWEWSILYKNTGTGADDSRTIDNGENSWRYWIVADGQNGSTASGFYITQIGNVLYLRNKYNNSTDGNQFNQVFQYTLPADNVTYNIKIQRTTGNLWKWYIDQYNATTPEAKTLRGSANPGGPTSYGYSMLESSTTTATGRFIFDDLRMYTRQFQFVTYPAGLSSAPIGPNQSGVVVYSVALKMRGNYEFQQLNLGENPGVTQFLTAENLYKSADGTFTPTVPAPDTLKASGNGNGYFSNINDVYQSSGSSTDGSLVTVGYYYIAGTTKSAINSGTLQFTGIVGITTKDNNGPPGYTGYNNGGSTSSIAFTSVSVSYASPQTYTVGTAISALSPTTAGSPTSYSTTGLPPGLSLNTTTGVISGTPTAGSTATNYSITASSSGGSATTTINITVNGPPVISYATPQNYPVASAITPLLPTNTGGSVPTTRSYIVTTFAGQATSGNTNGTGTAAKFTTPRGITFDQSGNLYIADYGNNLIRKITPAGVVTTFAGSGVSALTNGTGTAAAFNGPYDITSDPAGNLYVADINNNVIRKITTAGVVSTLALINIPTSLTYDTFSGNLFVTTGANNAVARVTMAGVVTTFAGSATTGSANGTGTAATFNTTNGITSDASGNLYVVDQGNNMIRKITSAGVVTTFAGATTAGNVDATGTAARFNVPRGISLDPLGNLYVTDNGNNTIRLITPAGVVTTISGGTAGFVNGTGTAAQFSDPRNLGVDPNTGFIYIPDYGNNAIRKMVPTGYSISAALPAGLTFDTSTGQISGTPTVETPATSYKITASNAYGSSTTTLTITVNALTPPTVPAVSICGAGTATITASGGAPTGGTYNFYTAATGGTLLQSTSSASYTTPFLGGGTTTYYVSYTVSGSTSARTAVTVTVNPEVSTPLSGGTFAYPLTGNANDVTGNLNTGNLQGTPSTTTDRFGNTGGAYSFNGSSQYISTTTSYVNPTTFSLSVWFNTTTTSGGKLIGFGNAQTGQSGSYDRHIYMDNSGKLIFGIYNGGVATIATPLSYNDGNWHHVVVTISAASGSKLYMDGALVVSNASMTTPEVNTGYWKIGYDNINGWTNVPTSFYFNGLIDDVAVYNRELTATEVANANDINLIGLSTAFCPGNAVTLTAPTIAGATYSWTDGTTTQNTQTASFTGSSSAVYTLTVVANGCSSSATITPGAPTYQWTGAAGTAFNTTASNWKYLASGTTQAPTLNSGTEAITIPAGITNYPVLDANRSIGSLTIESGATISLATFTLNVGCNIYNNNNTANGIISTGLSNGTINWNGTVAKQFYIGTNTTAAAQVTNMTVNNTTAGAALNISGGKIDVSNALTVTAGNIVVASTGTVTLKSSGTKTAYVPAIPSAYSISGNVTVERWFTGGTLADRGWRLLSSPVNNSSTVPASSAATYNFSSLKQNLLVTGSGGSANGFDQPTGYTANGSTILFYNTSNALFTGPATINTTRNVGTGYYFFFRGNNTTNPVGKVIRSGGNFVAPEANVVGLQTGTLNQQGIVVSLSNAFRGFNLVGNPYPSSVTIPTTGALSTGNTTGFIWTFSPRGTSITARTGPFTVASGQGFYVKATGAGATLTFAESMKTATQPTTLLMSRPKTADALADVNTNALEDLKEANVELQLIQDSTNYDFAQLRFGSQYKNTYDVYEDADDLNGSGQAVFFGAMTSDKQLVAIASQPLDKQKTSVFLSVDDNTTGIYTIKRTDLSNIPSAYDVWLMDHFKKDSLDLRANDTYKFNLDKTNTATFGNSRFEVVIRKKMLPPYQLLSFNGARAGTDVQLNWNVQNEYDFTAFELQRSFDGTTFEAVRNIQSNSTGTYNFKDTYLPVGTKRVYYRLKQVDINDKVSYSNLIIVTVSGSGTFSLYPNPTSNTITFDIYKPVRQVRMNIFNAMGILMKTATFVGATGRADVSNFATGSYTIEVIDMDTRERVLNGKFIKN